MTNTATPAPLNARRVGVALREAGHVFTVRTVTEGVLRIVARDGIADAEGSARGIASTMIRAGYDAVRTGRVVVVTMPEPVAEEPADADLEERVALVRDHYLDAVADARQDDHAAGIADLADDPDAVLDELLATAGELKVVAPDYWTVQDWQDDPTVRALAELARTITDGLTVAELTRRLFRVGTRVTVPARRPHDEVYIVVTDPTPDTSSGGRSVVWLALEADRPRTRSAWLDELVPVPNA